MRKNTRKSLFLLFCVLCNSFPLRSQPESLPYQEQLYIQTDRTSYLSGETIWLSVFCLASEEQRPSQLSKIACIELFNRDGERVRQAEIALRNGRGEGYLQLPSSIRTGHYYLRAFTSWMKNNGNSFFFRQILTVINPFTQVHYGSESLYDSCSKPLLSLIPEHGGVITGRPNRVIVSINNHCGSFIDGEIRLLNADPAVTASLQKAGTGLYTFSCIPHADRDLTVECNVSGKILQQTLYGRNFNNRAIVLTQDESGIGVSVLVEPGTGISPERMRFILFSRNQSLRQRELSLSGDHDKLIFMKNELPEGVFGILVQDEDQKEITRKYFYEPPGSELNIQATPNTRKTGKRERVELELQTLNANNQRMVSDLSVLVSPAKMGFEWPHSDILQYFKACSGVPEIFFPGRPDQFFSEENYREVFLSWLAARHTGMPLVKNSSLNVKFPPDIYGKIVKGRIVRKNNGQNPVDGRDIYLARVGAAEFLDKYTTGRDGYFYFNLEEYHDQQELVFRVFGDDQDIMILLEDASSNMPMAAEIPLLYLDGGDKEFIERQMLARQVRDAYGLEKLLFDSTITDDIFYDRADAHYLFDDYIKLPVMEEYFREIIREVLLTRVKGELKINILDRGTNRIVGPDPIFLVDGVPVFSSQRVLDLNPRDVVSIAVVASKYFLGNVEMDGILDTRTRNQELAGLEIPASMLFTEFTGPAPATQPWQPDYAKQGTGSRLPDPRLLLYWDPMLRTGKDGKIKISFYTSDIPGEYSIEIQGITTEGSMGSLRLPLVVE